MPSPSLLVHYNPPSGLSKDGGVTSAIDTTGCNLIVICIAFYVQLHASPGTPTDNKGNTYTLLTLHNGDVVGTAIAYCVNPTVGTGHTFTIANTPSTTDTYPNPFILGFGIANGGFDQQNGQINDTNGTSFQTGSITPGFTGEIIVALVSTSTDPSASSFAVDSGFTISDKSFTASVAMPCATAYKIQSGSISAENPTFSWTNTGHRSAMIASFRKGNAAGGRGGKANPGKGHKGGGGVVVVQPAGAYEFNIGNPGLSIE